MSLSPQARAVALLAFCLRAPLALAAPDTPSGGDWREWLGRGEAARDAGKLRDAAQAFAHARAAAPGNPIPTRAACEVARLREESGEPVVSSREPCHGAMIQGGLAEDLRNEVASLMAANGHPTLDDLAVAAL